jgi:lipoprotein-anchoring transpeptidase ErfK/SrfK
VTVGVEGGSLTRVAVNDAEGSRVPGDYDADRTTWTASEYLLPDMRYQIEAAARGRSGRTATIEQAFHTITPAAVLGTDITPLDGQTVGVGMPLVVKFSEPAADAEARAAMEERLVVETSRQVEGAWHWFDGQELHYRPRVYWPAGTAVTLRINTLGATNGNGAWGIKNKVKRFGIGRSVVTKTDLGTDRMKVYVDGKLARTIDVTGGRRGWETRHGTKVVLERRRNINFRNQAIGAPEEYDLIAPYGLRLTWSGEFMHSAPWSTASQGEENVSHGCVGMSLESSKWLWSISKVGDPAETTNTGGESMPVFGNGHGDWNLSWQAWKAGSALT